MKTIFIKQINLKISLREKHNSLFKLILTFICYYMHVNRFSANITTNP